MKIYFYAIKDRTAKMIFSDSYANKEHSVFYALPIHGFAKAFGFGMAYIIEDDFGHRELTTTSICSPSNKRFIEKHHQRFVNVEEVIKE